MIKIIENEGEIKEGWLLKWTNYMQGYKRRWFMLSKGTLSYYRETTTAAHAQRGAINLTNALIHSYSTSSFAISKGDSSNIFYLKADTETERNEWVSALERAKIWAINNTEPYEPFVHEKHHKVILMTITAVGNNLDSIQECNGILVKRGNELKEKFNTVANTKSLDYNPELKKLLHHWASLFRKTSCDMTNSYIAFIEWAEIEYNSVYRVIQHEVSQIRILEKLVIKFDHTKHCLEAAIEDRSVLPISKISIFNDTLSDANVPLMSIAKKRDVQSLSALEIQEFHTPNVSNSGFPYDLNTKTSISTMMAPVTENRPKVKHKERRTRIPDKPNHPLSLWSIMKNCIGKDLSKIPMPVNFSEPLSFLQRAAEDFTYSEILNDAASCQDSTKQLAHLAAFVISSYASTAVRVAKPFNPLLGETFEWDRMDDLGWRLISEQVSHHPPIAAQHCESKEWTCWQEFAMSSKFRGKYLMIIPLGTSHIKFHRSGFHYSWTKITTVVNNIIIGKLWVDNTGEINVINHTDSSKCILTFVPYTMFKPDDQRKVTGVVKNGDGQVKWVINGKWDTEILISPVIGQTGKSGQNYQTGEAITAWRAIPAPEDSFKYYNFSLFACQLNDLEEGVAPTDSRCRPDQRLMENGEWDEANIIKTKLEEKQRSKRKKHADDPENLEPGGSKDSLTGKDDSTASFRRDSHQEATWFKTELERSNGKVTYIYKGGYWEAKAAQDWSKCPDIFL